MVTTHMQSNASCTGVAQLWPRDEVLDGLRAPVKRLPCKLLYDARGAVLFEQICLTEDYYPTRNELALLEARLPEIAKLAGPRARVIEPGSGEGVKTRMLLSALDAPVAYVPIDVSSEQLASTAAALEGAFPGLAVHPVCADYTQPFAVPPPGDAARTVVFFPGSTIGNFEPDEARAFLARFGELAGPGAMLVLGADANDDPSSLLRAYDDSEGITAAFDLNMIAHVNATHGADFDLAQFLHRAIWNAQKSRIEMHLVSRIAQTVTVRGEPIRFARGEAIVTEHCYKHAPASLASLITGAGWRVDQVFADPQGRMRLWVASR